MNTEYIKDYRDKELKQFVIAYFLVTVAAVGFYTLSSTKAIGILSALSEMITIDILIGAISVLVIIFNELWSDKAKTRIVYKKMPSDSVFSEIVTGKVDATGFDLEKAKTLYLHLSKASANKQTAEWNLMLKKSRDEQRGNVIEAERMQLMTRDMCVSTVSLLIMNLVVLLLLTIVLGHVGAAIKVLGIPLTYLIAMFFITRGAARNRARRFVMLVIKNDVQRKSCEEF